MHERVLLLVVGSLVAVGCSRSGGASATTLPAPPEITEVTCAAGDPPAEIPEVAPPAEIPTELQAVELRPGSGAPAADGDTLFVDYVGVRAEDGVQFDTSFTRPQPTEFVLGRGTVIPGWEQGLTGARAGSTWRLDVPADLAFGDHPVGDVRPGDALSYVVEVRAVVPPSDAADAPLGLDVETSVGATELGVRDVVVGEGAVIEVGDTAVVEVLVARGDNRAILLNTWERSEPLRIAIELDGDAIGGLVQGLQCARVGSRRVITMPPEWAFGPNGEPGLGLPAATDVIVVADVVGAF